jgi:hypothetical protein
MDPFLRTSLVLLYFFFIYNPRKSVCMSFIYGSPQSRSKKNIKSWEEAGRQAFLLAITFQS